MTSAAPTVQTASARTLPLLIAAIFVVSIDSRVIAPLLPAIADDFDVSIGRAGLVVTAYLLPYGLFQLVYGPLADRVGQVRVVSLALGAFALGELACVLAPSLEALVALRFFTGAAAAATIPLTLAWIGETVDYSRRQSVIGYTVMAASLGQVLSAAAGGFMAAILSWRAIFLVDGLAALVLTALLLREHATLTRVVRERRPMLDNYRAVFADRRHWLFYGLIVVEGAITIGAFSFFGAMLRDRDGYSYALIGAILALSGLMSVLAGRFLGRIARRLGERRMIALGGAGTALAYALTTLQPAAIYFTLAMALVGLAFIVMHSTFQTRATEVAPAARATGISVFAFALFLGSAIGATVVAQSIDRVGYDATMLTLAGALAVFTVVATLAIIPASRPGAAAS